ncbi:MAG: ribonucleoside-diphosphate reductase subunit alpha [Gammaproteobacteria bacterium]|nr:ribonucleoside-diphosphate reductase subunit alpha [Gammaproteobacteria bacterium]
MSIALQPQTESSPVVKTGQDLPSSGQVPGRYRVIRRDGNVTVFNPDKIGIAITKAFLALEGGQAADSSRLHRIVDGLKEDVVAKLTRFKGEGGTFLIEEIQDRVELELMRGQHHKVARLYVLYREERAGARREKQAAGEVTGKPDTIQVTGVDGAVSPFKLQWIADCLTELTRDIDSIDVAWLSGDIRRNLYEQIPEKEILPAMILCTRARIEIEPSHSDLASRLLLLSVYQQGFEFTGIGYKRLPTLAGAAEDYPVYFPKFIERGIELELLDPQLTEKFDIGELARAIRPERDLQFNYHGIQTLYDRYLIHSADVRFELPQAFFMRVCMGLAMGEKKDQTQWAIRFYEILSTFRFMSSTPTLFNSATLRPQLSSCYLTTLPDDLSGIYDSIKENALLSKYAGGLGNDWTNVRALGSYIKGTNGRSQGVVPFLKVANDTAVAVNQGGKRKGAVCAYLEVWHLDIMEFLELRKNTGDDRRRTHDMNTASWIPDLFMRRVCDEGEWTLFSPDDVPGLHDLYGADFDEHYQNFEKLADEGKITNFRRINALELWRKMLGMLYETGHPWLTFKDVCNIRSPQQHAGVVHSSNLCTEITLNTNDKEIAVCNLGSLNLPAHITDGALDAGKIRQTIEVAVRMLDNVIDYNYYSVQKAEDSNFVHRPVGLGLMGFQDALYQMRVPYDSDAAVEFADESMELISYEAISASMNLAKERGRYQSFDGSLWSKGILPIDSLRAMRDYRQGYMSVDDSRKLDWDSLREDVVTHGMRNSNVLAIAPTATISNICGVTQSIEPTYQNLYVKSNLSGEFTVINPFLIRDLKERDLWDEVLANDLKYFDGSIQEISRIPEDLRNLYKTCFEIEPYWLVEAASRRQKWIDQSQSLNIYMADPNGKKLDSLYKLAWVRGLKTTYYLRSIGATHVEKSTLAPTTSDGKLNSVSLDGPRKSAVAAAVCVIDDPDCEACQ